MTQDMQRIITATREVAAPTAVLFELIADPSQQPRWDGNGNLAEAAPGQRVRGTGDVFTMTLTSGAVRENHVVAFTEGREIAWQPAPEGELPPGHAWAWRLAPLDAERTLVTHVYDWTRLQDETRLPTARATTAEMLGASLDRLAVLAEEGARP